MTESEILARLTAIERDVVSLHARLKELMLDLRGDTVGCAGCRRTTASDDTHGWRYTDAWWWCPDCEWLA